MPLSTTHCSNYLSDACHKSQLLFLQCLRPLKKSFDVDLSLFSKKNHNHFCQKILLVRRQLLSDMYFGCHLLIEYRIVWVKSVKKKNRRYLFNDSVSAFCNRTFIFKLCTFCDFDKSPTPPMIGFPNQSNIQNALKTFWRSSKYAYRWRWHSNGKNFKIEIEISLLKMYDVVNYFLNEFTPFTRFFTDLNCILN